MKMEKGKVIGLALSIAGAVINVIATLNDKQQTETTIKEMVDKAIADKKL